jgi:hypothetical protein
MFPPKGQGWYWGPEIHAAQRQHEGEFAINEWWEFTPATDEKPFDWVRAEAERRIRLKHTCVICDRGEALHQGKSSHPFQAVPANIPIKLGLNSIYGKTAQRAGAKEEEWGWRIPVYFQPEWAGFVTSYIRAALYDVAMQDPEAVIQLATDGIFATRKLEVPLGEGPGEWEEMWHDGMLVAQSGVYFYWNGDGDARKTVEHYRGFDRGSITVEGVRDAWRGGAKYLDCLLTRFVTLGQALASKDKLRIWRQWRKAPRRLQLQQQDTKRRLLEGQRLQDAAEKLLPTRPEELNMLGTPELSEIWDIPWLATPELEVGAPDELIDGVPNRVIAREAYDG